MFVELILQGYLALCEFRPMAGELSFEHALGTRGTLSLDRDGSEPACHTKKWTLHNEFHLSIHGSCGKFSRTQNSRVSMHTQMQCMNEFARVRERNWFLPIFPRVSTRSSCHPQFLHKRPRLFCCDEKRDQAQCMQTQRDVLESSARHCGRASGSRRFSRVNHREGSTRNTSSDDSW